MRQRQTRDGREPFEERIKQALAGEAKRVCPSGEELLRLKASVHQRIEEESGMKRFNIKKTAAVAAAICVIGSITAAAAGRLMVTVSHSDWREAVYEYGQMEEMGRKIGLEARLPEAFSNGYVFANALPVELETEDEGGSRADAGKSLSVGYEKEGEPELNISVEKDSLGGDYADGAQAVEIGGVTAYYSVNSYLFVPADYELTEEEEKEARENGLVVSYGTDEVIRQTWQSLSWSQDGQSYSMGIFDGSLTKEDMVRMAGEVIGEKG